MHCVIKYPNSWTYNLKSSLIDAAVSEQQYESTSRPVLRRLHNKRLSPTPKSARYLSPSRKIMALKQKTTAVYQLAPKKKTAWALHLSANPVCMRISVFFSTTVLCSAVSAHVRMGTRQHRAPAGLASQPSAMPARRVRSPTASALRYSCSV